MLKRRLQRLVRVYTCQNVKLLEISCHGSIVIIFVCMLHVLSFKFRKFRIFKILNFHPCYLLRDGGFENIYSSTCILLEVFTNNMAEY